MQPSLTIFIDGLPFDQLDNMPFARTLPSRARLVPILGYSVNCQTELFTGKSPDELGFWCEWSFDPSGSPFRRLSPLFHLLAPLEMVYVAKRVVHKVLDKFSRTESTKNIPFRFLSMFDESGHSVFSPEFSQESLLDHPDMTTFFFHQFPPGDDQDEATFQGTLDFIQKSERPGSVMLTLVKIDACSHWQGVGSEPYKKLLADNDRYIRELTEAFLAKEPDGVVNVVSDHGMTNIEQMVEVDLEGKFGRPHKDRYSYFTEATILRVWVDDPELREDMRAYLDGIDGVEELSKDDRERFGITRKEFGDLIYWTPVGVQIVPSFWGPKPSVGMHGHHPDHPGQHGICLASKPGVFEGSVVAKDFYRALSDQLGV